MLADERMPLLFAATNRCQFPPTPNHFIDVLLLSPVLRFSLTFAYAFVAILSKEVRSEHSNDAGIVVMVKS